MDMKRLEQMTRLAARQTEKTVLSIDTDSLTCLLARPGQDSIICGTSENIPTRWSDVLTKHLGLSVTAMPPEPQIQSISKALQRYYRSGKRMNAPAFTAGSETIYLHQLDEAFQEMQGALVSVIQSMRDRMEQTNIDENTIRIVVCGDLSQFAAIHYCIREIFCFNPFLEDDRFISAEEFQGVYETVPESSLVAEKKSEILLRLIDADGNNQTELAAEDKPVRLIVSGGERLNISAEGNEMSLELPAELTPGELYAVSISLETAGDKQTILLTILGDEPKNYVLKNLKEA